MDGSRQRILRATAGVLSWQPQGADGEPGDPGGVVTVGVVGSDGTTVIAAPGTATSGTGSSPRTLTLTAAQTQYLDALTATWKVGAITVATTKHDIVGGFYFSAAEIRAVETTLASTTTNADPTLFRARDEIETLIESVTSVAFVPRFAVSRLMAGRWIVLPWRKLRTVRWIRLWTYPGSVAVDISVDVVNYPGNDQGLIDLGLSYLDDDWQVEVAYEHGYDAPPSDLKRAAMTATRAAVNAAKSGVPDRTTSMQLPDGGTAMLGATAGGWHTGIPTVDEVINRYAAVDLTVG